MAPLIWVKAESIDDQITMDFNDSRCYSCNCVFYYMDFEDVWVLKHRPNDFYCETCHEFYSNPKYMEEVRKNPKGIRMVAEISGGEGCRECYANYSIFSDESDFCYMHTLGEATIQMSFREFLEKNKDNLEYHDEEREEITDYETYIKHKEVGIVCDNTCYCCRENEEELNPGPIVPLPSAYDTDTDEEEFCS